MKTKRFGTILIGVGLIGLMIDSTSWAQADSGIEARLKHVKDLLRNPRKTPPSALGRWPKRAPPRGRIRKDRIGTAQGAPAT